MRNTLLLVAAAAGTALAQSGAYGQCGGQNWSGATTCVAGYTCVYSNPYYSQCLPVSSSSSSTHTTTTSTSSQSVSSGTGSTCSLVTLTITATSSSTSKVSTSTSTTSTSASPTSTASGIVKFAGVNIAGFDFGCDTSGTCNLADTDPPGSAGIGQMNHFVKDDGLNAFRLPVAWQYLVQNNLGGTLDANAFANYDSLVQGCLSSGAQFCLIDIHNYARWNGQIIGQGGPTNAQFTSLWSQLATKYANQPKVAFGIMNEPHDLTVSTWAQTVQAAVTAIRQAGATSQYILLPGTQYTSGAAFISDGSGPALLGVTNPDGSTTNLIFDVHQYLDSDNSGTHSNCVTNNSASFTSLATWLRQNKRQAILSETGGGSSDSSCLQLVCQELATLNANSDVYLGWIGWAAGSFETSYILSLTPTVSGNTYTDQPLLTQCIAGEFKQ